MKKLVFAILPLLLLTACPKEKEVAAMMDELSTKRAEAIEAVETQSWDLDSLLIAHDYFFNFSERVHLLKEEPEAVKNIQKYLKKNGAKAFCESFVVPLAVWQTLETYCTGGSFYKCSPEIQEYANTRQKMLDLLGGESAKTLSKEPACN